MAVKEVKYYIDRINNNKHFKIQSCLTWANRAGAVICNVANNLKIKV